MSVKLKKFIVTKPSVSFGLENGMWKWTDAPALGGWVFSTWNAGTSFDGGAFSTWNAGDSFNGGIFGKVDGSGSVTFRLLN